MKAIACTGAEGSEDFELPIEQAMNIDTQHPQPQPGAPVLHSEIYKDGEIEYALQVFPVDQEFIGRWFCLNCTKSGFASKTFESSEEALRATKRHLKRHHSIRHPARQASA